MFTILLNQDFEDQGHRTERLGGVYTTAAEAVAAAIDFHATVEMSLKYDSIDVWQGGAYFGTAYPGDAEHPEGFFSVFPLHSHASSVLTGLDGWNDEIPF